MRKFNNMIALNKAPANKDHFNRLIEFYKDFENMCREQNIEPIIYGSLAILAYTQNYEMKVNDIDVLIREKEFQKIIEILKKRKIKYNYDKKWHVLQILKNDLKIEIDSIDFWQKELPQDFIELNLYNKKTKMVSLNTLKNIYKNAANVSQDNPQGNKQKFEILNKLD